MKRSSLRPLWLTVSHYIVGGIAVSLVIFACIQFGLTLASAAFLYLILVALVSLSGDIARSILLTLVAAACLDYFFIPQYLTLQIDDFPAAALMMAVLVAAPMISVAFGWQLRRSRSLMSLVKRQELLTVLDELPAQAWSNRPDGSLRDQDGRILRWYGVQFTLNAHCEAAA